MLNVSVGLLFSQTHDNYLLFKIFDTLCFALIMFKGIVTKSTL